MENYQSLEEALDNLRKRGYEADFSPDTDCLYCEDLDIRLDPEDFHIDEIYRFAVYAITSATGVKGTLVCAYGTNSANMSFEMKTKSQ